MITADDLQLDYAEMTSIYRKSGEDSVADMVIDYVDAQLEWGYDKFDGFYTSKAVTKEADGFTEHKAR